MNSRKIVIVITSFLALYSCSVERFIPEGELLYDGAEVDFDNEAEVEDIDEVTQQVKSAIRPEPNNQFLGMRPGLYFHYKAQRENPGFINKFLNKRIGEEPVYQTDVDLQENEEIILNRLENRGFFYSAVGSSFHEDEENKEATAQYTIDLPEPYVLEDYILEEDTLRVYREIESILEDALVEQGMRFNLTRLKAERTRIDEFLKEKGYYNFNNEFLIFEADTNQYDSKKFDLFLRLKRDVPQKGLIPYEIRNINVFPNYTMGEAGDAAGDTVQYEGRNYIQEEEFFKPKRLDPYILIEEGELYNPSTSRYTSRRLTSIGTYKFVNIEYEEVDTLSTDSLGVLDANIYLSPLNKRSIRAELQGVTKSNNFAGPNLALTFSNRNLFHGGEILNITANIGYERQIGGGDAGLSSTNIGLKNDLIFPRLLFPISTKGDLFRYSIPKTRVSLGGEYLNRTQLYSLGSVTASFGYTWNANRYVTHQFDPLSVSYVSLTNTTEEFEEILDQNPFLRSSFEQQFIEGILYYFTYNGMVDEQDTHQIFLGSHIDLAGNKASLLSGNTEEDGTRTLFGLEYAQYAKADLDFRYHLRLGSDQKIATRLFAGYGLPYGNSEALPFAKQFYSGGPYSVRAFRIRSLGPGTYEPEDNRLNSFFDQAGDIRLEANLEYRFPIVSVLKGAVFADAGNVWNNKENEALPGGQFSSDFLKEMGVGVGAGLRVDIQNFVIRFDLAAPVRTPYLPEGERWRFDYDEPVLNFAVGYPF